VTLTLTDTLPKTLESLESLKSTSDAFSTDGYYITAIISCDESSSIIPVAGEIEIYSNDSLLPGTYVARAFSARAYAAPTWKSERIALSCTNVEKRAN